MIPADFIDTGLAEEVLAKTCPGEWRGVKEDEVRYAFIPVAN